MTPVMPRLAAGALVGLAWACGLRGLMTQVTTDPSTVTWAGTFVWVLAPGVVTGLLLGWADHLRRTTATPAARWLVLAPFAFTILLPVELISNGSTLQGGVGGGTLGVPAYGVIGAYALAGSRLWARVLCGLIALSAIPIWALTATGIGGASLSLSDPKGLWIALYYWTFLAVLMMGCAIPLRIGRAGTQAAPPITGPVTAAWIGDN